MNSPTNQMPDWETVTAPLKMISERFLPLFTRAADTFWRGNDKFWQIVLADGRIGWAESLAATNHRIRYYYVPQDVADEPWLRAAAAAGYTAEWADSDAALGQPALMAVIRRASPARKRQLDVDAALCLKRV